MRVERKLDNHRCALHLILINNRAFTLADPLSSNSRSRICNEPWCLRDRLVASSITLAIEKLFRTACKHEKRRIAPPRHPGLVQHNAARLHAAFAVALPNMAIDLDRQPSGGRHVPDQGFAYRELVWYLARWDAYPFEIQPVSKKVLGWWKVTVSDHVQLLSAALRAALQESWQPQIHIVTSEPFQLAS